MSLLAHSPLFWLRYVAWQYLGTTSPRECADAINQREMLWFESKS